MRDFSAPDNSLYSQRDGSPLSTECGYHPHSSTRFRHWGGVISESLKRRLPELYVRREDCCGCTSCVWSCPKGAISMEGDEEGFNYPVVDVALCVGCRKCLNVCVFKMTH